MKLKKLFAFLTVGAIALSSMSVTSSAADDEIAVPVTPTENVEVLYDAPIPSIGAEFTPRQLGKGTDGAKLRFTYYSAENKSDGSKVIGIAGKANDANWTWLQADTEPGLTTAGYGVENVEEVYYDELVALADIGTDVRCYVFCNWGIKKGSNVKIELITPTVNYASMTLFDGTLANTQLTPDELGKNVPGSKIRFTFTSDLEKDWGAVGICGKEKGTWTWVKWKYSLLSNGIGKLVTYTFSYADFVEYAGIGDNLECFEFQDWGIAVDTNVKIELLVPAANLTDTTATVDLFSGELTEEGVALTPAQLGKYTAGAVIKITYTGAYAKGCIAIGISSNYPWQKGINHIESVGVNEQDIYIATYADFVAFTGITNRLDTYVFQNWGLAEDSITTIQLVMPVESFEAVDEIVKDLYNGPIKQWQNVKFTPHQLGQGINGAVIRISYISRKDTVIGEEIIGIAGISKDDKWVQGENSPAFVKNANNLNIKYISYDEFVKLANINESDVNYYVFSN